MARDIDQWLEGLDLGRYAEAFADNEIDLDALPYITEEDLKEIGGALVACPKPGRGQAPASTGRMASTTANPHPLCRRIGRALPFLL